MFPLSSIKHQTSDVRYLALNIRQSGVAVGENNNKVCVIGRAFCLNGAAVQLNNLL